MITVVNIYLHCPKVIEITRDQDAKWATELEAWLDQVATTYNILDLDGNAFCAGVKLMHKRADI